MTAGLLIALTLLFALVNGINDGAAINAATLKAPGFRPIVPILVLGVSVAAVPVLVGAGVARTLRSGLLAAGSDLVTLAVVLGVVAAMMVVGGLAFASLPTSLTLGVVGGIVGAGWILGAEPRWATLGRVAVIGLAAPVVGALLALGLSHLPVGRTNGSLRAAHVGGLVMQSVAYAANDGQKMVAIAIVTVSALGMGDQPSPWLLVLVALCFFLGTIVGLPAASNTLSGGVLRQGPREEVVVEYGAGAAVLASAALGAPVSMTQAIAGGIVGVGLRRGQRQIRWRAAAHLVLAWILTLPLAAATAAALGGAVRSLGLF